MKITFWLFQFLNLNNGPLYQACFCDLFPAVLRFTACGLLQHMISFGPMQHLVDQPHCHLFYKKWQGLTENETFYKSGTNFLNEITFLCELIHTFPLSFLEAYLSLFPASGGPIRSVLPGSCRGLLILPNTVKD